jgi:hypothetical protein
MGDLSKKQYLILSVLLVLVFFKTYSIHNNYPFPYHQDEWQHIALSLQANDLGYNRQFNPYLDKPNYHFDLESGFHLFLSSLFLMTNLDPILNYQYLAAFFSVLTAASLFLCVLRLSKKQILAFVSVIVFLFLPTNVNILGKDFFVPLTMAMPFIFLFSLYYIESLIEQDLKKFMFSAMLLFLIFLIHPPSFIILLVPAFFELMFSLDFVKGIKAKKRIILGIILFILLLFFLTWRGTLNETKRYIKDLLIFEQGWGKLEITFFIPLLYGLFNSIFAIIGFIYGYKTKFRFFVHMAFFSLAITAFFNLFGFTVFVPYSRAVHYAMLSMIPLTALGFNYFLEYLMKSLNIKSDRVVIMLSAFLLFTFLIAISKYDLNVKYSHYTNTVIDDADYRAFLWINENVGANNIFVTPYFMTSAVYPISKNKVISLIPAQMEGGPIEDNLNFYTYDCAKKKEIIIASQAKYILSKSRIVCDYLKEIYHNGDYVYLVNQ